MTTYEISMTPRFRWQVTRGTMIMAVFGTRTEAETYCERKRREAGRNG